ncbi:MAG TPA: putative metalloprotease CJM1_0395 family protein [Methylococcaceae bacterium]|nr:putative metalloprotease CJM1_0395 family protein [Methylococcaceae bacterium]
MIGPVGSASPSLSPRLSGTPSARASPADETAQAGEKNDKTADPDAPRSADGNTLSEQDRQVVENLKTRDREVRAHEAAHLAAAAGLALGGASYSYTRGPDGRAYATGGEVSIDVSPVPDNPEATAAKAQQIHRAALAPAHPSGQDRAVAAAAAQMEAEARQEILSLVSYSESNLSERRGRLLDRLA